MIKGLKLLSTILGALPILILISFLLLGVDAISSFLGINLLDVSIERHNRLYSFSILDKLPIIFFLALAFSSFFFLIAIKTDCFISNLSKGYSFLCSYISYTFQLIKSSNVKFFLLTSFALTIYLAFAFPLTLDEPQTYYDFIKPPFWEALALYPYPNNHVLSSLMSNITNEIPGLDLLFRIRIPVIIVSLLTWIFAYRFVRKFYSENLALFVVAIGTVVETNLQHAYIARGYAYVMFFVVIGVYAAFNIIQGGNRKRDWLAFVFSSALGAWTMPSYLYPFLSISIFIFIYQYKQLRTQVLYSILIGVFVLILYSPILIVTGLDGLTSNEFVASIDRVFVIKSLPGFMLGTAVHIFYIPAYTLLVLFALIILYTIAKRDRNTLILWLVFGLTPSLFLIIHSVLPFFRTFFYYGFLFVFMIGVSFKDEIKKVNTKALFCILLIIHCGMIVHFFYTARDLMKDVFISDDLRKEILKDEKSYYFHTAIPYLEGLNVNFEIERQGFHSSITYGSEGNVDLLPPYDYYIMEKEGDTSVEAKPYKEMKSVFSVPINVYRNEKLGNRIEQ